MTLATVSVLIFSYASVFAGKEISGEVVGLYASILGAYATSKTIVKIMGDKSGQQTEIQKEQVGTNRDKG